MKKTLLLFCLLLAVMVGAQEENRDKNILMVVSGYGKDKGAQRPGFEFDEFSQAYLIFTDNGFRVTVASPKGGAVEADNFNTEKAYNKRLLENEKAMALLANTQATATISAADFDAVYVVGGKGAMFDLPYDPALQDIILEMYKREGTVISAVCHGPAAFVNVKESDKYLIDTIEMTGFCNMEEDLFGKKWVQEFPFRLEDRLKARGAKFVQADFMLPMVATSGKFVTGQNPFATPKSAEAVIRSLGITPVERTWYTDENSMYLVQDVLQGKQDFESAATAIKAALASYDVQLIAVYGYYKTLAAQQDTKQLELGVRLMELASPHYFNERLWLHMAKTYMDLDKKEKAIPLLNELVGKDLMVKEAQQLLTDKQE